MQLNLHNSKKCCNFAPSNGQKVHEYVPIIGYLV